MTLSILAGASLIFALWPAIIYARNVRLYRRPPIPDAPLPSVSILIPARATRRGLIERSASGNAALATRRIDFRDQVVLDDHSEDETARIVRQIADRDRRVRLVEARPNFRQAGAANSMHASCLPNWPVIPFCASSTPTCASLKRMALARMAGFLEASGADLVSGFPQQVTLTFFIERHTRGHSADALSAARLFAALANAAKQPPEFRRRLRPVGGHQTVCEA